MPNTQVSIQEFEDFAVDYFQGPYRKVGIRFGQAFCNEFLIQDQKLFCISSVDIARSLIHNKYVMEGQPLQNWCVLDFFGKPYYEQGSVKTFQSRSEARKLRDKLNRRSGTWRLSRYVDDKFV